MVQWRGGRTGRSSGLRRIQQGSSERPQQSTGLTLLCRDMLSSPPQSTQSHATTQPVSGFARARDTQHTLFCGERNELVRLAESSDEPSSNNSAKVGTCACGHHLYTNALSLSLSLWTNETVRHAYMFAYTAAVNWPRRGRWQFGHLPPKVGCVAHAGKGEEDLRRKRQRMLVIERKVGPLVHAFVAAHLT